MPTRSERPIPTRQRGLATLPSCSGGDNTKRAEDVLAGWRLVKPQNVAVLSALAEIKISQQDWAGAQQIGEAIRQALTSATQWRIRSLVKR